VALLPDQIRYRPAASPAEQVVEALRDKQLPVENLQMAENPVMEETRAIQVLSQILTFKAIRNR
jgi:hypothetical protein